MAVRRPALHGARTGRGAVLVVRTGSAGEPRTGSGGLSSRPSAGTTGPPPLAEGTDHLRAADPVLRALVDRLGPLDLEQPRRGRPTEPFGALVRSIVGQQLSTKAARSIYERLTALFGGAAPTPEELLAVDPEAVRGVGLSRPKVAYLRDLAGRVADGELDLSLLAEQPDEEVTAELTQVKGLGRWSADMFLIFHLGRPDVLPVGDLGVRRAVERAYALAELPPADELIALAEPWRPHRSLASLYLWRSLDAEPT